ncbi:hypothetical protein OROGR_008329 [Orobanche gracilis]
MAEGGNSGGPSKSRTILGDITNRISKRGLSEIEKTGIKTSDFIDKDVVKRVCASPLPCTDIISLKGTVVSDLCKIPDENRDPNLSGSGSDFAVSKNSIGSEGKNVVIGNNSKVHGWNISNKILDLKGEDVVSRSVSRSDVDNGVVYISAHIGSSKDVALPMLDKIASWNYIDPNLKYLEGEKAVNSIAIEADGCVKLDVLKENMMLGNEDKFPSLEKSVTKNEVEFMTGGSKKCNEESDPKVSDCGSFPAGSSWTASGSGNDCLHDGKNCEGTQSDIRYEHYDVDDHNADNFVLSQTGSIDCTVQSESQKEDEYAYMSGDACLCSFCTNAAYMWLDLNYQDTKARLSVTKKSQKAASILAERNSRIKFSEKSGTESFTRASKLESHLIYQWKSLFQGTSDIWEKEGNHLEASLLPLIELREKCKTDSDLINAKRTGNH